MVAFFLILCFHYSAEGFFSRYLPILLLGLLYFGQFYMATMDDELFTDKIFSFLTKNFDSVNGANNKEYIVFPFMTFYRFFLVFLFFIFNPNYWKRIFKRFRDNPVSFFLYFVIAIFLYFSLFRINSQSVMEDDGHNTSSENQEYLIRFFKSGSSSFRLLFLFNTILIVPFWEEIIWRYLPSQIFYKKGLFLPMIVFATAWFALAHVSYGDLIKKTETFSLFLFLERLFQSKLLTYWYFSFMFITVFWIANYSLPYSIVLHMLHNIFAFFLAFPEVG